MPLLTLAVARTSYCAFTLAPDQHAARHRVRGNVRAGATGAHPAAPITIDQVSVGNGYFLALHFFEVTSHIPPAFSQSPCVMYCERFLALLPDGLADGVLVELPDDVPAPGVVLWVPEEAPEPELPALPLPVPRVCAAAIAGNRAIIATRTPTIGIFIF